MATRTPTVAGTYTLSGTTADTVTFQQAWDAVEIDATDASNDVYVRWDGTAAVSAAAENDKINAGNAKTFRRWIGPDQSFSVVANGDTYTVAGVNP